jgi:hypothetical protein
VRGRSPRKWSSARCGAFAAFTLTFTPLAAHAAGNGPGGGTSEKAQCIEAYDRGQDLRDSSSFRLAREAFSRCARDTCPDQLKRDCVHGLVDLDARYPSIVIVARSDRGKDLEAVTVFVDGSKVLTKLDGSPLSMDPGAHHLRYEADGFEPVEDDVIVRTGEKDRPIDEILHPVAGSSLPPSAVEVAPKTPAEAKPRVLGWTFAGVGALAFVSEAIFGISGAVERSAALSPGGCAPHCSASQTQGIETKFIIADVSLGIGAASAATALYFLLRPAAKPPASTAILHTPTVDFQPRIWGAVATVGGSFQ